MLPGDTMTNQHRITIGSGRKLHLGISTCPNDTFAFAALLEGRADTGGFEFTIDLLDIDQLNEGLMQDRFDVAKTSFHAALVLAEKVVVLPVGSALGFGVGPLLLAARAGAVPGETSKAETSKAETSRAETSRAGTNPGEVLGLTLCPGELTTAKLLFDLFYPETTRVEHVVFSEIMPRLTAGTADFGVCIHEGRFTYEASGLHCVADLGQLWETQTNCPLPLGGLVMRSVYDEALMRQVSGVISGSLAIARQRPETALPAMRRYAQSMDDAVLMQHVELYVNDWTVDLGDFGKLALERFSLLANERKNTEARLGILRVLSSTKPSFLAKNRRLD